MRLFGIDLENATGAVVDNLGIVSVNVKSCGERERRRTGAAELGHRGADLVMIMIGANEAQWLGPGDQDTKHYQAHYEKVLAPIRKARPDAACLVVSPTDQAEAKDGGYVSRPVMPLLVDAQRKAAHAQGCAFFSTYDWMGGKGSAAKWFRKGLVGSDFQHLTQQGREQDGRRGVRRADERLPAVCGSLASRSSRSLALLGCGSGCDGERAQEQVEAPQVRDDGHAGRCGRRRGAVPDGAVVSRTPGFLDAPAGTLDTCSRRSPRRSAATRPARVAVAVLRRLAHRWRLDDLAAARDARSARFGDAGRGLVAAGRPPARHYYQRDVRYGASGTWKAAVGGHRGDNEPFGIVGLRVFGERKGAQLWVETCRDCQVGRKRRAVRDPLLRGARPRPAALSRRRRCVAADRDEDRPIEPPHPARQVIAVPDGPHKLTLEHGGGGVLDLFGVVMERLRPGVIVDSLGVVGRRLGSLRLVGLVDHRRAAGDARSAARGAAVRHERGRRPRSRSRGDGALLRRDDPADPRGGADGIDPDPRAARHGRARGRQGVRADEGRSPTAGVIPECEWRTPSVLGEIISVEHAAAVRNNVAFFDTFAAMGGADHMHAWVIAEPKIAYKDHVHFTDLGYQRWADALSGAILGDYARWRTAQHLPPTTPITIAPPAARRATLRCPDRSLLSPAR